VKFIIAPLLTTALFLVSCGLFNEGDPVDAKTGITAKWQSDVDPGRIMEFKGGGKGHYTSSNADIDQGFSYAISGDDNLKITFQNGEQMKLEVRTTTLYLWVTNEQGTERFHKYE